MYTNLKKGCIYIPLLVFLKSYQTLVHTHTHVHTHWTKQNSQLTRRNSVKWPNIRIHSCITGSLICNMLGSKSKNRYCASYKLTRTSLTGAKKTVPGVVFSKLAIWGKFFSSYSFVHDAQMIIAVIRLSLLFQRISMDYSQCF